MKHNVGSADKLVRIMLGVFLVSLTMWGPQTLWGLVGIIPIATGLMNSCPIYSIMNLSTNKTIVKTEKLKL